MKRIWLWMAFLTLVPSIAEARFYPPLRHRVRYSPYALSYRGSGLIPGGIKYSAYAFGPGSTGLVLEGTRYTPYAYSYRGDGLIVDYSLWHVPPCAPIRCCPCTSTCRCTDRVNACGDRRTVTAAWRASQSSPSAWAGSDMAHRSNNGLDVIRQYLRERGCRNVGVSHILRVDGVLVSVSFTLRDQDLIIKYWNPEAVESLETGGDYKARVLEKYRTEWERLANAHRHKGGEVYRVHASEQKAIVASLNACEHLIPPAGTGQHAAMYAKK